MFLTVIVFIFVIVKAFRMFLGDKGTINSETNLQNISFSVLQKILPPTDLEQHKCKLIMTKCSF